MSCKLVAKKAFHMVSSNFLSLFAAWWYPLLLTSVHYPSSFLLILTESLFPYPRSPFYIYLPSLQPLVQKLLLDHSNLFGPNGSSLILCNTRHFWENPLWWHLQNFLIPIPKVHFSYRTWGSLFLLLVHLCQCFFNYSLLFSTSVVIPKRSFVLSKMP